MTLELAKSRRLDALRKRSNDRVLVQPKHPSETTLPDEGTVAGYLMNVLSTGCEVDTLIAETGWSRSQVMVNLFKLARKTGFGIRRKADQMYLVLPENFDEYERFVKVVNPEPGYAKNEPREPLSIN